MKRILEAIRARLAAWLSPSRVTVTHYPLSAEEVARFVEAMKGRAQSNETPRVLEPAQQVPQAPALPEGTVDEWAVVRAQFFTAFDGIAGAAYNAKCEDGVLRPFTFEAGGDHARVTCCLLTLHNGHMVMGVHFGHNDGAHFDAAQSRDRAYGSALDRVDVFAARDRSSSEDEVKS